MSSEGHFIPLSVPTLQGNEWHYVKQCLDTGWVSTAGSMVGEFEEKFRDYVGAQFSVCTSSGTSALHLALLVSAIGRNEEVLVPSMTFIAPVNAIRYVGAYPVFIDSDPFTFQMDPLEVESFLLNECSVGDQVINKSTGRAVAAILPVHILGYPADLVALQKIATKYKLKLIEDATESLGSSSGGSMIGSKSPLACFSFNGNKLMTTGAGGMITSNSPELARMAKHLSTQAKSEPAEYVHDEVGYNYRLPNLLAALGCAQVEQLTGFIKRKLEIAQMYDSEIQSRRLPLTLMRPSPSSEVVPWLYTVLLPPEKSSRELIGYLRKNQIESRPLWQPNHRSVAHADSPKRSCPVADDLYLRAISLPCSSNLTELDQIRVINTVTDYFRD